MRISGPQSGIPQLASGAVVETVFGTEPSNSPRFHSNLIVGLLAALALCLPGPAHASRTITIESLLKEMTDRSSLARLPDPPFELRQYSSHDPAKRDPRDAATWHSNHDYEQFLRTEQHGGRREWVIMDADGPGAITRFWLPLNADRDHQVIRFYLDGSDSPAITAKFNELMSGRGFVQSPFAFVGWNDDNIFRQKTVPPATQRGVAGDLYLPIPYARHCKITLDEMPFYYIIDARSYQPGTSVRSFTMEDYGRAANALKSAAGQLAELPPPLKSSPRVGVNSIGSETEARVYFSGGSQSVQRTMGSIGSHSEERLDLPDGAHSVQEIEVKIDPDEAPQALRSLVLSTTFDGETTIWCPIGDFFGAGNRLHAVHDRFRVVMEDGTLRAFWVMPYRKSASVSINNVGGATTACSLSVSTSGWRWDDRSLLFHSRWHCTPALKTRPRTDWNYIAIKGAGQYVGDTLSVYSPVGEWYGEGDERIYIDGETFPSHIGTGTEDYYGYAWGMAGYFSSPWLSTPRRDREDRGDWHGFTTTSRLRLLDSIPFTSALKVDMEIWNWADTTVDYGVATFWYARPGATDNRQPQPAEAALKVEPPPPMPPAFKIAGAIECEDLRVIDKSPGVEISTQNAGLSQGQWSGGKQMFGEATKVGDSIELEVPVGDDAPRIVVFYGTKSFDYGILRFSINGKPVAAFDGYSATPQSCGPIGLGTATPKDGKLVLKVEVVGSNPESRGKRTFFGLDCLVLKKL